MRDEQPRDIWVQHEEMLAEFIDGDGERAEQLARRHIEQAADFMIERLAAESAKA
jgi:DNA-binding GntR family transcriptional regulator